MLLIIVLLISVFLNSLLSLLKLDSVLFQLLADLLSDMREVDNSVYVVKMQTLFLSSLMTIHLMPYTSTYELLLIMPCFKWGLNVWGSMESVRRRYSGHGIFLWNFSVELCPLLSIKLCTFMSISHKSGVTV